MVETVEEFLARGGKIETVPSGKKAVSKSKKLYAVWNELTQAWESDAFPSYTLAAQAAAMLPDSCTVKKAPKGLPKADKMQIQALKDLTY